MIDNRMKAGPIVGLYDRLPNQKGDYSHEPAMARAKRHYIPGQIWHTPGKQASRQTG